ncbi:MAG: phosphotransferase [Anaerolineae bacterium]|nr:phosphotransferase [Anaerolineae bacterium]
MKRETQNRILEHAARNFDAPLALLKPLAGGHYAQVCEWEQDGKRYVLKIAPLAGADELQSTRAMLEWLAYLAAHDAPILRPVFSQRHHLIETIEQDGQTYLVSASEKIAGVRAEKLPAEQWDMALIEMLGRVIGRCHVLAQTYVPAAPALTRPQWDQADSCFNPRDGLSIADDFVLERRAQVLDAIASLPKDRESYGLAHLDIHFANFIVDPERRAVTLIDFDDCGYGWYMMDIAMLIFDVQVVYAGEAYEPLRRRFLDGLLTGYRQEKALPTFWVDQLPLFLKLLEIGVYAMVVPEYDPQTCTDEWVNTFMAGREQRIRDDVPYLDPRSASATASPAP